MGVGVVNRTLNAESIILTFRLSERLDFGARQRGSDNRGWSVVWWIAKDVNTR